MKKILSTTAIAGSLCLLGTSAFAQFVGPYVGISGSVAGVATTGKKTTSSGGVGSTSANTGEGPAGIITPLAAIDAGYSFAAGKGTTIALGATWNPMKGEFDAKEGGSADTNSNITNRTFSVKDVYSVYIQPTFEINKDAAFFVKGFYTGGQTSLTGTAVTKPGDLEGWGGSAGLRVMLTKDAFIQVEAAYSQYDNLTASIAESVANNSNLNTPAQAVVTRTFTADKPSVAEGRVTLGFKF
jgi:hypothetical protein